MTETAKPKGKSYRHIPILLFLVAGMPVIAAFFMYFTNTMVPETRNNKGNLVVPPLAIHMLKAQQQRFGEGETDGKWTLIVMGENSCASDLCQETLHKIRQVNVALGREADRVVRRYINIGSEVDVTAAESFKESYPRLHLSYAAKADLEIFLDRVVSTEGVLSQNYIFISDPLGNVMMYYTPANPGGDVLDDMKKLLKVSKIG